MIRALALVLALGGATDAAGQAPGPARGYSGHGAESVAPEVLARFAPRPLDAALSRTIQAMLDVRAPGAGVLSDDGRRLFFSWRVTGTTQLWRLDGPDRFPVQLTGGEDSTTLAAVTPDGRTLVVQRDRKGEENPGLYLLPAEGGPLQEIQHRPGVQTIGAAPLARRQVALLPRQRPEARRLRGLSLRARHRRPPAGARPARPLVGPRRARRQAPALQGHRGAHLGVVRVGPGQPGADAPPRARRGRGVPGALRRPGGRAAGADQQAGRLHPALPLEGRRADAGDPRAQVGRVGLLHRPGPHPHPLPGERGGLDPPLRARRPHLPAGGAAQAATRRPRRRRRHHPRRALHGPLGRSGRRPERQLGARLEDRRAHPLGGAERPRGGHPALRPGHAGVLPGPRRHAHPHPGAPPGPLCARPLPGAGPVPRRAGGAGEAGLQPGRPALRRRRLRAGAAQRARLAGLRQGLGPRRRRAEAARGHHRHRGRRPLGPHRLRRRRRRAEGGHHGRQLRRLLDPGRHDHVRRGLRRRRLQRRHLQPGHLPGEHRPVPAAPARHRVRRPGEGPRGAGEALAVQLRGPGPGAAAPHPGGERSARAGRRGRPDPRRAGRRAASRWSCSSSPTRGTARRSARTWSRPWAASSSSSRSG